MQTHFSPQALADPEMAQSERVVRACVRCGFCTATCPTYALLGAEADSPRGRIYAIKDMLEQDRAPTATEVLHLDRCLSCLACETTCPSGVRYGQLIDHARRHVERRYRRPAGERLLRWGLGVVLPRPALLRVALAGARVARGVAGLLPRAVRPMLELAPAGRLGPDLMGHRVFAAEGVPRFRVALLAGCAQRVLGPHINDATVRLLVRHGCEVVVVEGAGCCGALNHHLGQDGLGYARRSIQAWDAAGVDAVVVNTSGCGTMVKEYGALFAAEPALAAAAARVAAKTRDISEWMLELGLQEGRGGGVVVAYHDACSLRNGQHVTAPPRTLLRQAGFQVAEIAEAHLCCGSAGTYNLLQPEIAGALRARKVGNIEATGAAFVVAGNIGCITQIGAGTTVPVMHLAEALDWATGGPLPPGGLRATGSRHPASVGGEHEGALAGLQGSAPAVAEMEGGVGHGD